MNTIVGMASHLIDIITTIQKDQKEGPSGLAFDYLVHIYRIILAVYTLGVQDQTKNGH